MIFYFLLINLHTITPLKLTSKHCLKMLILKVKILILIKIKHNQKFQLFLIDINLPLKKSEEKYTKFLTPRLSLRHSQITLRIFNL